MATRPSLSPTSPRAVEEGLSQRNRFCSPWMCLFLLLHVAASDFIWSLQNQMRHTDGKRKTKPQNLIWAQTSTRTQAMTSLHCCCNDATSHLSRERTQSGENIISSLLSKNNQRLTNEWRDLWHHLYGFSVWSGVAGTQSASPVSRIKRKRPLPAGLGDPVSHSEVMASSDVQRPFLKRHCVTLRKMDDLGAFLMRVWVS